VVHGHISKMKFLVDEDLSLQLIGFGEPGRIEREGATRSRLSVKMDIF